MSKRFLLLLAAYVVPTFLLGFVWHLVLFDAYYKQLAIYRDQPIIPFGLGSMILQGVIFAWVYPRLTANATGMSGAFRFAMGAALLSWSFTTLAVAAKSPMTSIGGYMLIETGFTIVQFLLVGPALALAARASTSSSAGDLLTTSPPPA